MIRIIAVCCIAFVAFTAGRLSVPPGTITLASGAKLTGPFVMTDGCITAEPDAKDIFIGEGVRLDRGACRYDKWSYLSAAVGRWPWTDKWWWQS